MRNSLTTTTTNESISSSDVMNINHSITIETNNRTAMPLSQSMAASVAVKKSQPKVKCVDSGGSRPTKRPPSERRFKCDQCERMFFTRKDVKRHLVVHTGIRNFACPYCTQRFGRKDHLVRHAKKSHNRDTRSSTTMKGSSSSSAHPNSANIKCQTMPNLIEPKMTAIPVLGHQMAHNHHHNSHMKQTFNYSGNQNSVLLANNTVVNNNHNTSAVDNHCPNNNNYPLNCNANVNGIGMTAGIHANESLCHYMPGCHNFDDMMSPNAHKSETPSPLTPHHYFTFPVNSSALSTYPLANHCPSFIPNCLVTNTGPLPSNSSCGQTTTAVAAFGIPVSNMVSNNNNHNPITSNHPPIHTAFSVDVNPSLPHFNQAFQ
ncbi:uncharacterized protein LOC128952080 [Oppia nitens]|uniref:uncharacterized protein LOC128952080 n=1 Tax=Oppia nitens TaxID=1686743 RepID=UPI0023DB753F|nr:uncharacterized protein LOC128952080 [Oppia nitens]